MSCTRENRFPGWASLLAIALMLAAVVPADAAEKTKAPYVVDNGKQAGQESYSDVAPPLQFVALDEDPEFVHRERITYPRIAKRLEMEGTVWLHSLIDSNGTVREVKIAQSSGSVILDEAALEGAIDNLFEPAVADGHSIPRWVTHKVIFEM